MPSGDPYKPVTSGDPLVIPSVVWNRLLDVARGDQPGPSPAGNGAAGLGNGIIRVKNNSGADRARWEVLGLDVPLVLPGDNAAEFARQVALAGVLPTAAHAGKWALLLEPVAAGAIGRAVASGVTVGKVNVTTGEEAYKFADAEAGLASLQAVAAGGAEQLWRDPGAGLRWAVLRFPAPAAAGGGGGGTGTGVEVKEADGTPDYTGVSVLVFDSSDGFVLSQPAGGQARLDLAAAGPSQDGIVTSRDQQIEGEKTFLAAFTHFGRPFGQFFIGNYGSASNPFGSPAGWATELRLNNPNTRQMLCSLSVYPEGVALPGGGKYAVGTSVGQSGTLADGSTLTGGLVTAIGPGGVDGGTW
jgi:hypothetical protein